MTPQRRPDPDGVGAGAGRRGTRSYRALGKAHRPFEAQGKLKPVLQGVKDVGEKGKQRGRVFRLRWAMMVGFRQDREGQNSASRKEKNCAGILRLAWRAGGVWMGRSGVRSRSALRKRVRSANNALRRLTVGSG